MHFVILLNIHQERSRIWKHKNFLDNIHLNMSIYFAHAGDISPWHSWHTRNWANRPRALETFCKMKKWWEAEKWANGKIPGKFGPYVWLSNPHNLKILSETDEIEMNNMCHRIQVRHEGSMICGLPKIFLFCQSIYFCQAQVFGQSWVRIQLRDWPSFTIYPPPWRETVGSHSSLN